MDDDDRNFNQYLVSTNYQTSCNLLIIEYPNFMEDFHFQWKFLQQNHELNSSTGNKSENNDLIWDEYVKMDVRDKYQITRNKT